MRQADVLLHTELVQILGESVLRLLKLQIPINNASLLKVLKGMYLATRDNERSQQIARAMTLLADDSAE